MQDQEIIELLQQVKTIALVGASDNPSRPSYGVMAYLLAQGYGDPGQPKTGGADAAGAAGLRYAGRYTTAGGYG